MIIIIHLYKNIKLIIIFNLKQRIVLQRKLGQHNDCSKDCLVVWEVMLGNRP